MDSTSNIDMLNRLGLYRQPDRNSSTTNELGQDAFMQLMLTQMRNQDPLSPMDNSEFIAQLAQFSTVSGVQKLDDSFQSFALSMQSNQALQAAGLVGRSVCVTSDLGNLTAAGVDGEIELPSSTGQLGLEILDRAGQVVRHVDLGGHTAGVIPFHWDGTDDSGNSLPPGTYRIAASALIDGSNSALRTNIYAQVESVSLDRNGTGMQLNLAGLGARGLGDVQQIR